MTNHSKVYAIVPHIQRALAGRVALKLFIAEAIQKPASRWRQSINARLSCSFYLNDSLILLFKTYSNKLSVSGKSKCSAFHFCVTALNLEKEWKNIANFIQIYTVWMFFIAYGDYNILVICKSQSTRIHHEEKRIFINFCVKSIIFL